MQHSYTSKRMWQRCIARERVIARPDASQQRGAYTLRPMLAMHEKGDRRFPVVTIQTWGPEVTRCTTAVHSCLRDLSGHSRRRCGCYMVRFG